MQLHSLNVVQGSIGAFMFININDELHGIYGPETYYDLI